MSSPPHDTHMIVLPGGGYATHVEHEAEPIVEWLNGLGLRASVFRCRSRLGNRAARSA
jgi:hypothetical protein